MALFHAGALAADSHASELAITPSSKIVGGLPFGVGMASITLFSLAVNLGGETSIAEDDSMNVRIKVAIKK